MSIATFEIPCVILCGGKSSRMGEDKALLPFSNSKTLTQFQFERLKPHFKEVYLSSKTNKFDFLIDEKNIILDKEEVFSPMAALKSIFDYFGAKGKIFIITVDTPFVGIDTIRTLIINSIHNDITLAKTLERKHNLCGVFDASSIDIVNKMIEEDIHKVGFLLQKQKTSFLEFKNENEFINLNNKEDYEKAKLLII